MPAFTALELDRSTLRTCARELDDSRWGALELDYSKLTEVDPVVVVVVDSSQFDFTAMFMVFGVTYIICKKF